ncbi:hypothetical protein D2T29_01855 [Sinirhodobacter populi]|uniref:Pilus assembly protein n=1 Tax=Paenirhodobacter populi TaxID=2306993 RepID=A0A443KQU6_9RHOB|nr:hypothetical protein [Sinirhodobacter populi]RWR35236.1 hypothetical protein D2T29_01855 [Sinirhodobacter populi]
MIPRPHKDRFRDDGAVTLPTIFWIPVFFMILLASVELMVLNMRQVLLDRAVDVATRDLRLGNAEVPTHEALRNRICSVIAFVSGCRDNLSVEVFPVDTSTWSLDNPDAPRCADFIADEAHEPVFDTSTGNRVMALRACLRLKPMTGVDPLAMALRLDQAGRFTLSTVTVFVNEPRNTGTAS